MTIYVVTPEHGTRQFDADEWDTPENGNLLVGKQAEDHWDAEFTRGAWLFVYEIVAPVADEVVWKSGLDEFPVGVDVWDREGGCWEGEGPGGIPSAEWGPFTTTPPEDRDA